MLNFDICCVHVESVKSIHQYFRFFEKELSNVNIAILELGPVSNESPGNFTFYRGIHEFLNLSTGCSEAEVYF